MIIDLSHKYYFLRRHSSDLQNHPLSVLFSQSKAAKLLSKWEGKKNIFLVILTFWSWAINFRFLCWCFYANHFIDGTRENSKKKNKIILEIFSSSRMSFMAIQKKSSLNFSFIFSRELFYVFCVSTVVNINKNIFFFSN